MAKYNVENIKSVDEILDNNTNEDLGIQPMIFAPDEPRVTVTERVLNIPDELQTIGVENDNNVERIYFEIPRYFDEVNDLSEFNFYINYLNANQEPNQYHCTDLEVEGDNVVFSWLTSENVYAYRGIVRFIVYAVATDNRKWNTTVAELNVLEGLETEEQIIDNNPDIIDELINLKPQVEEALQRIDEQQGTIEAQQSTISSQQTTITNQQNKITEQQDQIDNAIDIIGDYEIVQENPTQIRFKKGNGTFGDTVNLGDNLASKSMVNAGYDTYSGNSYSGSASDYGIEIGKASGAYKQEGIPTPESPVEPKFFEPKEFVSVGKNCLDVSSADKFSIFNGTIDEEGYINIIADGSYKNAFSKPSSAILKPNMVYTFVVDVKENNLVGTGIQMVFGDSAFGEERNATYFGSNKNINFSSPLQKGITKFTIKTKENFNNVAYADKLYIHSDATSGSIKFRYAIYEGDLTNVDIGFEPFKGSNITPLNIELRELPNGVRDTYENRTITRRVGEITFDGSSDESFTVSDDVSSGLHRFGIAVNNYLPSSSSINVICDRFKVERYGGDGWSSYSYNVLIIHDVDKYFIFIVSDDITGGTLEGFKTWLQYNPIKVWYELATPTTEQVDLPVIPSYYPFTNVWHDSEVEASDLTWNILARQYGSGQTTIKKDEAVLTELDLNTERIVSPTTVKVQLKDTSGNVFYVETSADNVYLKGTDGSEISIQSLNDKLGQIINLIYCYSASPVSVLTDLKKYITTIS